MNKFFKKLPLLAKLMLIGLIPICFLVYLTIQVYHEKTAKLQLYDNYKSQIAESADINKLIDALQEERKFSFDYAMTKSMRQELILQRPRTDAYIERLINNGNPVLKGFTGYTKLRELNQIRSRIDSGLTGTNDVMHFYSNTVFRLNTLNTIPPANTAYLQPIYNDLMLQKILSEMITYLGIIRSNIYNVLYTKKYMIETMMGTVGTHDVYNSYEAELLVKGNPEILQQYKNLKNNTALQPTMVYIDTLFKRFSFDSSYTATQWWKISDEGVNELRKFQNMIWGNLNKKLSELYQQEKNARNKTLISLIIALVSVVTAIMYIVFIISSSLRKLRFAAEKIANGETGVQVMAESADAIGSLAHSISKIDKNNHALTIAALEIGKGNFDVETPPRSNEDVLGNAIIQMKKELQQYSRKMEQLVALRTEELARSNEDLQQFAHVASHDLKEPLRKIITFSDILSNEQNGQLSDKGKLYLQKVQHSAKRMAVMIEAVLEYSMVNLNEQVFENVDLNKIMEGVQNDLELAIIQKDARINYSTLPHIKGIQLLLEQLFYNLLNNGLKFSKENVKPVISITAQNTQSNFGNAGAADRKLQNSVHITVSDNGIGFNPAYAQQMFNAFSRLNSKDKYEGTGLGLALCRKIVQRHGGQIYAEGEEGQGAVFHIFLPV